jgi:uncharacterized membrane protein
MNKEEYINKLKNLVKDMPLDDREDIISDYEEHFRIGMENGRSEEEISAALGDPNAILKNIKAEHIIKKAENKPSFGRMMEAVLAAAGLGIFNLIFVLGPFLIIVAIILGLIVTGFSVIFAGISTVFSALLQPIFPQYINLPGSEGIINRLLIVMGGAGLTMVGVFLVVVMAYIGKWFYNLLIRYLKLNLRIINGRSDGYNN